MDSRLIMKIVAFIVGVVLDNVLAAKSDGKRKEQDAKRKLDDIFEKLRSESLKELERQSKSGKLSAEKLDDYKAVLNSEIDNKRKTLRDYLKGK